MLYKSLCKGLESLDVMRWEVITAHNDDHRLRSETWCVRRSDARTEPPWL